MALTIGPRLRGFFGEVLPAILATLNDHGSPEMTPVWYEFVDGRIRFNGDKTRLWLARMEQTGRATFFVMDRENDWRWVQVYGKVVDVRDDLGGEHINRLAHRYRGRDYTGQRDTRRSVTVEITSIKGADGSPRDTWDVAE
jgi:PPOX class probable F420-dependent enzyme